MQLIEIIGIIIETQFSCQLQKIWASGQRKTLGPTKRCLKNGETSDMIIFPILMGTTFCFYKIFSDLLKIFSHPANDKDQGCNR